MKRKKNKAVIIILSILAFVLLASGVFYGTYYFIIDKSSNSYEKEVKVVIDKVNEVNNSVSSLFKGQAIDPQKARTELSAKIDSLTKQKNELEEITPTDKYKKDHENLLNGLNNNILIFRQIDAIAKNPNGKDIDKAGEDLLKYKDKTVESYALVNIANIKIRLTDNAVNLVNYTSNLVNVLVKDNRDKEITQGQNNEYIDSMDALLTRFAKLNVDLSVEMTKVRNAKGNMDNVIALAEKNKDSLAGITQEFESLSVPSKAVNNYKLFKSVLDNLEAYLSSFAYAASNEKLAGSDLPADKINELYGETTAKFSEVTKTYNSFLKSYSEFRQASTNQ